MSAAISQTYKLNPRESLLSNEPMDALQQLFPNENDEKWRNLRQFLTARSSVCSVPLQAGNEAGLRKASLPLLTKNRTPLSGFSRGVHYKSGGKLQG
ncbi:hypothetical protein AVEN_217901-1 [Araneus ventricosus]|uniref:Uncharacterized protein n=1 Tax=Araneus ventricosus TaxID=182803 RepID=A0A4Y2EGQ0_ARAVE|nr:hypothetical protein AVEN_217901-1 [Araneus ventricosus]